MDQSPLPSTTIRRKKYVEEEKRSEELNIPFVERGYKEMI